MSDEPSEQEKTAVHAIMKMLAVEQTRVKLVKGTIVPADMPIENGMAVFSLNVLVDGNMAHIVEGVFNAAERTLRQVTDNPNTTAEDLDNYAREQFKKHRDKFQ